MYRLLLLLGRWTQGMSSVIMEQRTLCCLFVLLCDILATETVWLLWTTTVWKGVETRESEIPMEQGGWRKVKRLSSVAPGRWPKVKSWLGGGAQREEVQSISR